MTGCAAYLLGCGATTLHSWAKIGKGDLPSDVIYKNICLTSRKQTEWKRTQLLIIDEVSMMSKKLFELLDRIGKTIRKNKEEIFGGIQLIFSGDFYQLPPVGDWGDADTNKFCFESSLWNDTFDIQVEFNENFRQKNEEYIAILNEVRVGKLSKYSKYQLKKRVKAINNSDIKPIRLFAIKRLASQVNRKELHTLKTETNQYSYTTNYEPSELIKSSIYYKPPSKTAIKRETEFLLKTGLFEENILLKVGSQVMCIANLDVKNGITNGSTGIIIEFNKYPVVRFNNNNVLTISPYTWKSENIKGFGIQQVPLILAWAITIHKSQGATLDSAIIDAGNTIFECGHTYVALSRVKDINSLYLSNFDSTKIRVNPKVRAFYKTFEEEDIDTEDEAEIEDDSTPIDEYIPIDEMFKQSVVKPVDKIIFTEAETQLLTQLKLKRKSLASELKIPLFCVFTNKTLDQIAKHRPSTKETLSTIYGIGPKKLAQYGDIFIELIKEQAETLQLTLNENLLTSDVKKVGKPVEFVGEFPVIHKEKGVRYIGKIKGTNILIPNFTDVC